MRVHILYVSPHLTHLTSNPGEAYRAQSKEHHPDLHSGSGPAAPTANPSTGSTTCCAEARKLGRKSQSISRCEGWCHSHDRVRMEKMNDAIDSTDNHEIRIHTVLV